MWLLHASLFLVMSKFLCQGQHFKLNELPIVAPTASFFASSTSKDPPSFNDNDNDKEFKDFVEDEKIKYYLSKRVEDAFTIFTGRCTASIIAEGWIITAAHCINSYTRE